jgi:glycosyltransferase involved in cell wall biosynthesis
MISAAELRSARALLPGCTPADLLAEDARRLCEGFHGPVPLANGPRPSHLYLGARSGLEALAALMRRPGSEVVVVEPRPDRRGVLGEVLGAFPGGHVVPDLRSALGVLEGRRLGVVRVDAELCSPELLTCLEDSGVDRLCGTYDEARIDPLLLYRVSRDRLSRAFAWRPEPDGPGFGSDAGPVDIEVSVVVPAYNVEPWLDTALRSLAAQTLAKLEVVVVDDGSTDATGSIAEGWAARDGRFRVIRQANAGCAAARNAGLAAARGEYVGFLDADDWADPRMFEELYRAAVLRGAEIAQCGYAEAYPDGAHNLRPTAWGGDGGDGRTGIVRDPRTLLTLQPSIWRRIYRRDFLHREEVVFPAHVRRFDDLPFAFLTLARARTLALLPDCYYAYRQQRPGQDIEARDERLFVHFELFDWLDAQTRPWVDHTIRGALRSVQLATHRYALARIEKRLRRPYLWRALRQMRAQGHGSVLANLRSLLPAVMRAGR